MSARATGQGGVVVVGSANLDLVYRVGRLPAPGETVLAVGAARHPGGKGNNQAIAAARAGATTAFVAAIGEDDAGDFLTAVLRDDGVELHLRRPPTATGTALITVDEHGENTIVVDSGANADLVEMTETERSVITDAGILLLQLESPLPTVIDAARTARAAGVTVVLNAAPFRPLPDELLAAVDVLVVNEGEAAALGESGRQQVPALVVTMGSRGALVRDAAGRTSTFGAPTVTAVDTTGAGDTFCGALAAGLAEGKSLVAAARFATVAAALSVRGEGAVSSITRRADIDAAMASWA